jgi:hypothetical protein
MADRYWMGPNDTTRSSTWGTSTTNWSADGSTRGASAPTSADTVYFPDYGVPYTITITGTINCNNFFNDNYSGTTFNGSGTLNVYGAQFQYGDYAGASTWPHTGTVNFVGTTALTGGVPTTITSNGVPMSCTAVINSPQVGAILGGYWTVNKSVYLNAGTLDVSFNGMACWAFFSTTTSTRTLVCDFSTWIDLIGPTATSGMLFMETLTGFNMGVPYSGDYTYSGGFRAQVPSARSFYCGSSTYSSLAYLPKLKIVGSGTVNIASPAYFDEIDLTESDTTVSYGSRTWNCRIMQFGYTNVYTGITLAMNNPKNLGTNDGWIGSGYIYTNGATIASLSSNVGAANLATLIGGNLIVTGSFTHTSGDFQLTWDVTLGNQYSSSNSNVRKLIFNYAGIYFSTTTSGVTLISMATATNYSFEGYGDTLGGSYGGAFMINTNVNRTISIGSSAAPISSPDVYWFDGNFTSALTVTSGSWFNVFRIGYTGEDFLGGDGAYPGGALTSNITLNIQRALLLHTVGGTGLTINTKVADGVSGILALKGKTITSITVNNIGTGMIKVAQTGTVTSAVTLNTGGFGVTNGGNLTTPSFTSPSNTSVRALDFSDDGIITLTGTANNIVLNMPRPTNCTVTGGINSGFVSNMNVAKIFNYGATSFANNEFLPTAPGLKLTGSSSASINDNSSFGYLNLSELNSTLLVASGNGALRLTSLRLNSAVFGQFTAKMYGDGTISSTAPNGIITAIEMTGEFGYATALANSINCSTFTMNSGRLDLEGFNLRAPTFNSTVSTASDRMINGPGRIYDVDTISVANGAGWAPHASYGDPPTLEYRGTTLNGGGGSFGILDNVLGNEMTITGSNYFADLKASVLPATFKFTSGTTTTFGNITASGTAANKITLRSTVPGSQATFTRVGWSYYEPAPVEPSYLILQDINATGTAQWPDVEWRAYNGTITDGGNNTGWLFLRPSTVNGQFLVFFEGIS